MSDFGGKGEPWKQLEKINIESKPVNGAAVNRPETDRLLKGRKKRSSMSSNPSACHFVNSSCVPTPQTAQLAVEVEAAGLTSMTLGSEPGCVLVCLQESQTSHEGPVNSEETRGARTPLKSAQPKGKPGSWSLRPTYGPKTDERNRCKSTPQIRHFK